MKTSCFTSREILRIPLLAIVGCSLALALDLHAGAAADGSEAVPAISIVATPDIPLAISEVRVIQGAAPGQELEYKLSNLSQERLLAAEITWNMTLDNGDVIPAQQRVDHFFANDPRCLSGGATERMTTSVPRAKQDNHEIRTVEITGKVTFAQFADGTNLGSDSENLRPWLKSERAEQMLEYQRLSGIQRGQGAEALRQALASPAGSTTEQGAAIQDQLQKVETEKGIQAVIEMVNRNASLTIPN